MTARGPVPAARPEPPAHRAAVSVAEPLRSARFRYANELQLHEGIGQALAASHITFDREVRLDGRSRIDFVVTAPDGRRIGVEVKVAGSAGAVTRQLARYAAHVDALVLVTTVAHHLLEVPWLIAGKPCVVVVVRGSAW